MKPDELQADLRLSAVATEVRAVRSRVVRIPVDPPVSFSTRQVRDREYVLVTVESGEGLSGTGYTYAGDRGARAVADAVDELLAPLMLGRDALARQDLWELCFQDLLLAGRRGIVLRALSAVDIACWDLLGQLTRLPLYRLLGGAGGSVPAYGSGGYYRAGNPLEQVRDELRRYAALGFEDFKIKFGRLPLAKDLERVATARETIGPDARLALDVNNGWSSVAEGMTAIGELEQFGIWWVEEPFAPDAIQAHATLAARSPVPIATGEIEATRWAFGDLLTRAAAHILQPDACVAGGISEWLKIADAAAAQSIPVAPHWHANVHAQLAAAQPNCMTVEYFAADESIYNFEELVSEPLRVQAGRLVLPDRPGVGIAFDPEAVERYTVGD